MLTAEGAMAASGCHFGLKRVLRVCHCEVSPDLSDLQRACSQSRCRVAGVRTKCKADEDASALLQRYRVRNGKLGATAVSSENT